MGRVVTVGKYEDPNEKFPKFETGIPYRMRVTKLEDTKIKSTFTGQDEDRLYIYLECTDPVHPSHRGRTNRMLTSKIPTTDMRNQLTQLLMYTIMQGRVPTKDMTIDLDLLTNQEVMCTFEHKPKNGRDYERVVAMSPVGGFAGNAPVSQPVAPQVNPSAQQRPMVPPGWQTHFDAASGKWIYLAPGAQQWQWEPPPAPVVPPAPMVPPPVPNMPQPNNYPQQPMPNVAQPTYPQQAPNTYQQPPAQQPPSAPMPFPTMPNVIK